MNNNFIKYSPFVKMAANLSKILFITLSLNACSGCSKSGIREANRNRNDRENTYINHSQQDMNVIKMEKENGVYHIPVEINGVKMYFVFDTGAGLISISATEAIFLYKQGKLKNEDFIGTDNFIDATGNISEGTIVVFKSVKIGNRTLNNVEASVVHNLEAPLLLGQSALEKLGKVSIDYNKNEITFE